MPHGQLSPYPVSDFTDKTDQVSDEVIHSTRLTWSRLGNPHWNIEKKKYLPYLLFAFDFFSSALVKHSKKKTQLTNRGFQEIPRGQSDAFFACFLTHNSPDSSESNLASEKIEGFLPLKYAILSFGNNA